ncbi:MAG: glycosyltransferase [Cyanobium sp. Prado107]|nr:glycosyltransferase [Cyanobium sp. Prado107]
MPPPPEPFVTPQVSVVMPVWNAASCLPATLRCLQAQTLADWELLAVDDGSTDESAALLAEAAAADPRVRLHRQPNSGVSCARNRGVELSRAPLIAFLDADDLWHPSKLTRHVEQFRTDPQLGLAFARVEFLTPEGLPTGQIASWPRLPLRPADLLAENPTTTTSNWVVRRDVFAALGGFVESMSYSEDLEWLVRLACDGRWHIEPLDAVLTYYRTSAGGLSASLDRMDEGWRRLIAEVSVYAPGLVERHAAAAEAVHLRYLARRSLRLPVPAAVGRRFMARALRAEPWRLLQEPRRTGLTLLGVALRPLLPPWWGRRGVSVSEAPLPLAAVQPHPPQHVQVESPPLEDAPLVSVVIPLYNSAATVAATLESVLAQTYPKLEILVVDDGSTDDGVAICRHYSDPRIQVLQQSNRGLAGARNTGIRHAHGAVVAFVDSDDLWDPQKIARHLEHFRQQPHVGVSYSRSAFIDADGNPLGLYQTPALDGISPELILCRNPISNGSCVVIRREVLDQIRFEADLYGQQESYWFDDSFRQSEDIECWLRIALTSSWRIAGIPEPLTLYRVSSGGLSANIDKQYASWQRVIEKTARYAPELIRHHGDRARAYQLRYLARRAIRERQPRLARRLIHQALRGYPRLWLEEPMRTGITLIAAQLGVLLPARLYRGLEAGMIRLIGALQRVSLALQSRSKRRAADRLASVSVPSGSEV